LPQEVVLQQQQRQQQQQQQRAPGLLQPLAELAGFFSSAPDDPFTLYGTNFKKYEIEQMQGEKVVSRSRGFTVDTCVSGKAANEETPMFNGLSTGAKVGAVTAAAAAAAAAAATVAAWAQAQCSQAGSGDGQ
jgi:hypothetical protein